MSKLLEKVYYSLPLPLQNLAISAFGYHWYRRRFGGIFQKEHRSCKKRAYYTKSQWEIYQTKELRDVLLHAYYTVPYYQQLFKEIGLQAKDLENFQLGDLPGLPILEKDNFRKLGTTVLLSTKKQPQGEFYASSGSTGTPTRILYSQQMHQKYFAIFETCIHNWAGLDYKVPRGVIGGRRIIREGISKGPFYRYNFIEKQAYFSAYHVSAQTVANYLEGMIKHKVEYMTGYASANYFLARFIEEAGLKAPKLRAVLTSSEKLTDEMRNTFRRVYGCEAFDSYNGVEASCLISECEHGRLHIVPDVGIVEVLRNDGTPCKPGEIGEVITTGLLNFDQPLIRYRMGDLVKISENQACNCQRNMLVIDEIVGRLEDTVIGKDGREIMRFHGVFINIPSIIEAQVIQYTLSDFEIKLAVSTTLTTAEFDLIRKRMISQLGVVDIKFTIVDSIPRSANGKFKAVVSHIKRAAI